jgi:hypothetical protein
MAESPQSQKAKGGKNLTTSAHRKERYTYYKSQTYAKNKLKRIIQSCGVTFAQKWARSHTCEAVLQRLVKNAR